MKQLLTNSRVCTRTRRKNRRARRGFSMMLVLISLGTATILTTAYLTARDNSITIGENVVFAAEARSAATSGLDLGIAILETASDWRTDHVNGVLVDNYDFGDGTLDLLVEDMETNAPPTASTTIVRLTSVATTNGVSKVSSAVVHVGEDTGGESGKTIEVDLSEFAVFTATSAELRNSATITRWPTAPLTAMGKRVAFGTQQTNSGGIIFTDTAAAIDTTVYYGPGTSSLLISNEASPPMQLKGLLDKIPLPDAPPAPTLSIASSGSLTVSATTNVNTNKKYDRIDISTTPGLMTITGDVTIASSDDIWIQKAAGIIIDGNVTMVVTDEFRMDQNSFVELMPGATLTLFVNGSINLNNAYLGVLRTDRTYRPTDGTLAYNNPDRIRIFTPSTGVVANVTMKTVINGNIYGSRLSLNLANNTCVYGRVACRHFLATGQATIYYDPALDSGHGYTNPDSYLFESDGRIKAPVRSLTSLSTSSLQTLSDALTSPISTLFGLIAPSGGGGGGTVSVGPTDPTPRTVNVDIDGRVDGNDFNSWEAKADGAIVLMRNDGSS